MIRIPFRKRLTTYTLIPMWMGLAVWLVVALASHPRNTLGAFVIGAILLLMTGAIIAVELNERHRPLNRHDVLRLVNHTLLDVQPNAQTFFQQTGLANLRNNQAGWTTAASIRKLNNGQLSAHARARLSVQPPAEDPVLIVKDANGTCFAFRFTGQEVSSTSPRFIVSIPVFDSGDFGRQRFLKPW